MIALLVVDRRPDLVSGMVLIDSQEPQLWFHKTGETLPATSRRTFMMALGWRVGLVRIGLRFGQPDWIDNMSEQNQAWFKALYSHRMPGYGEVVSAYRLTDPSLYKSFVPGSLGSLPIKVLVHVTVTNMLSPEFEGGWMDAQKRLAGYSARSQLIVAESTGHAMVGENPDFVADHLLEMVEEIRTQSR
jgi:pimeloyl-ACP methyl ester carboxylesterase